MDLSYKINKERLLTLFSQLVSIDSESFHERKMADRLIRELAQLGFEVSEDEAGDKIGGEAGNLYAYLKGDIPDDPVLFSGHMDTVKPGKGKRAVLHEDGRITSGGDTVLGSDDLNAVCAILEAVRSVIEAGIPRRDIEIVFSVCEEPYCEGIKAFDLKKIRSKNAYILDMSGRPGSAAFAAPSVISFEAEITGRSAHAGFCPEEGINSIKIMSKAIASLKQGHLDPETTFNIGVISGGLLTNIVPERSGCKGEIRSLSHERALAVLGDTKKVFQKAAQDEGASLAFSYKEHIRAYETKKESVCVKRFKSACRKLDLSGDLVKTFGGSDNNIFAQNTINGIVLSCGMNNVHSTAEYTDIEELCSCAALVAELATSKD